MVVFHGDLPWYKVKNHLKQIQDYVYLNMYTTEI